MKRKFALLAVSCVLAWAPAHSENVDYIFRSFEVDDGLSQNTVYSILQTSEGFMWFGTKEGLNYYDGTEFRHIAVKDAIPTSYIIHSICEGDDATLWMATEAGLCKYSPLEETISRVPVLDAAGGEINARVGRIVKSPSGDIWASLGGHGLLRIFAEDGKTVVLSCPFETQLQYDPDQICFTPEGTGYLLQSNGKLFRTDDNFRSVTEVLRQSSTLIPTADEGRAMIYSPAGYIYVAAKNSLTGLSLSDLSITTVTTPITHDLALTKRGDIWLATDEGIRMFDTHLRNLGSHRSKVGESNALKDDAIYSLYCDDKGGIWGGTYFRGAFYMVPNNASVRNYYAKSPDSIMGERIREIHQDKDKSLWIGTEDKGLLHFFPDEERFERIDIGPGTANVQGILVDDDYIWVGTHSASVPLIRIDKKRGDRKYYPEAGIDVSSIIRLRDGSLLAGTHHGVMIYDEEQDMFLVEKSMPRANNLYEDNSGNVWAASNSGLYVKMTAMDEWMHLSYDKNDPQCLPSDHVNCVYQDRKNRIWVATVNGGLAECDPATYKFTSLLENGIIPYNTIYGIVEDEDYFLWLTTNHGIIHYNTQTEAYTVYSTQDGLISGQFNYNSLCLTYDGRIYAGTPVGIVSFDPYLITRSAQSSPIVLTTFKSTSRNRKAEMALNARQLAAMDRVTLRHKYNSFDVGIAVINYQMPDKNRFMYKLEDVDNTWHMAHNGVIRFSNLRSGNYILHIKGVNADDSFNGQFRDFEINVKTPMLLSWWALMTYILLAMMVAAMIVQITKKRNDARLSAATRELEYRKEKEIYKAKFDFFTNIAHEIKTPLSLIKGPAESLRRSLSSQSEDIIEDVESVLRNSDRLTTLVGQLLDFRRVEANGFEYSPAETDVAQLLRGIFSSFEKGLYKRQFTLNIHGQDVMASVDKELMTKLFTNLMSNAVKYSESFVAVEMSNDENSFTVTVANDGEIVPLTMRESIFTPFIRFNESNRQVTGTGIGLPLSRSLAGMHGGTLVMDDDESINRFVLNIPVTHATVTDVGEDTPPVDGTAADIKDEPASETCDVRKTVLVVDDNQEIRRFVARQLEDTYTIIRACDGKNALGKLETKPVDLIISDVMMPVMDGFELCDRVKSDIALSHIPIILLTAKDDIGSKIAGMSSGAEAYMEKPFSIDLLKATVKGIFDNRARVSKHFSESVTGESMVPITDSMSKVDKEFIEHVERFIMGHISDVNLSVDDLASEVCMSTSSLFRKMKGLLDLTPSEYIQGIRLRKAAQLLELEECTIAEISDLTGFSSHSYFSSCFKKQFGKTPKEYQRKCHSSHADATNIQDY